MPNSLVTVKKMPKSSASKGLGRSFSISMKGIPKVDAKAKARLEAAARSPDSKKKRFFPILIIES